MIPFSFSRISVLGSTWSPSSTHFIICFPIPCPFLFFLLILNSFSFSFLFLSPCDQGKASLQQKISHIFILIFSSLGIQSNRVPASLSLGRVVSKSVRRSLSSVYNRIWADLSARTPSAYRLSLFNVLDRCRHPEWHSIADKIEEEQEPSKWQTQPGKQERIAGPHQHRKYRKKRKETVC